MYPHNNRHGKTLALSELLDNSVFAKHKSNKTIGKVVKVSTIFSFWNDIVGKKFANFTKPTGLNASKLYVSAKSPVIVQELSLCKNKLLHKINSYSAPLGIEITDIVFSYKNFNVTNPIQSANDAGNLPKSIDNAELENLEIDDEIQRKIQENIERIKFLNDMQKNTLVSKIISTYKVKNLQDI